MNIIRRELKSNLKSILIWCLSMVFLIYSGMLKYSGYAQTGDDINKFMDQLPSALKAILGVNGTNLTSVSGFYSIFFLYFLLLAGAHAVMLGAVIISKEERDKTADFLYVKPVKRFRIITGKLISGLINILLLNLTTMTASIVIVNQYNTTGESITMYILRLMLSMLFFQIVFFAIGLVISSIAQNTRKATSLSTSVLLITFMLSVAIDLKKDIDFLRFATPFKYFIANEILKTASLKPGFIILSVIIAVSLTIVTYYRFEKKDLRS